MTGREYFNVLINQIVLGHVAKNQRNWIVILLFLMTEFGILCDNDRIVSIGCVTGKKKKKKYKKEREKK